MNGGVLDRIMYMMMNYNNATHHNIVNLKNVVNRLLGMDIISLNYMGYPPGHPLPNPRTDGLYAAAYTGILQDVINNPTNRYFKIDDDVIYIHPGTFENMIISDNANAHCTIRFANIAGANWRCSYIHQSMGLYNDGDLNPKKLQFGFDPFADCGWHSAECAQLSLNTFLSLHKKQQLNRYLINRTILMEDKYRFSINFFMISKSTINCKALAESLPIDYDDEEWWTVKYVRKVDPHCVVGSSLVVHFSYAATINALLNNTNLIKSFEYIVYKEHRNLPHDLWKALRIH